MVSQPPFSLKYRDILFAVLIVLFAFALRVVVVLDRAHGDVLFDPLPNGSDQLTYYTEAQLYDQGKFPDSPFRYLPGISYYFVVLRHVVGPSIGMMRLATSWTGALSCGLLIGAGWLLTQRKSGGYLAGLLMAIYPVAIFFSTEPLDTVLATFYVGLFLFLALWQKERLAFWRTIGLGLVIGLLAITRQNLATMALAWLVLLWFLKPTLRTFAVHMVVFLVAVAIPIIPVTLTNIYFGQFQLVTNVGIDEVYRANNRDGSGTYYNRPPAWDTVVGSYNDALMTDIRLDPRRFIELQGRKFGIYWSNVEPANDIDYILSGLNLSPLLRAIPLDFRILSILGLFGLGILLFDNWRSGTFMALINLLIFAGIMLIWVEGRLRQAAVPPLVLTAAYGLPRLPEIIRAQQWRRLAVPALTLVVFFAFGDWALRTLPHKRILTSLPDDTRKLDVVFDGKIRLLGWRPLPDWVAAGNGWATPNSPYVVELFWELDAPTDQDYNFYLAYVDNGTRYGSRDREIGTISFPPTPTSTWTPSQIFSEISGFRFPGQIPAERSGDIQLGVYLLTGKEGDDSRQIIDIPVTSLDSHPNFVTLQKLGMVDLLKPKSTTEGLTKSSYVFGTSGNDPIALRGYSIPTTGTPGEKVTFTFDWQAQEDIRHDYNLFVHVMDANNVLAAQHDGAPRDGAFVTSTWAPNYPVRDDIPMTLPDKPGVYKVYIGLYEVQSHDRLPIDAPDYRPLIAEITVK